MKGKILQIVIISGSGIGINTVGQDGITEIRDESIQQPDGIDSYYTIWKGEHLFKRIENCPVDITYETPPRLNADGTVLYHFER